MSSEPERRLDRLLRELDEGDRRLSNAELKEKFAAIREELGDLSDAFAPIHADGRIHPLDADINALRAAYEKIERIDFRRWAPK